ncbi:MAG: phosphopantothenoylcysteine decarboxylase [Planctomycetaceae bacterium]|nr:phosphopantothenoylcysteine decarboxylase [Planctomycetaceae bacterium]
MMKEILFGVSGGIAAYKSAAAVSRLVQQGFGVTVVMTNAATELIAPKTFESLSGRPVRTSVFHTDKIHAHIELAREADLFCIAPATANILAKAAHGIADDLLCTLILSFEGTLLFAPAMNTVMWNKPSVQRNVRQLVEDGALMIGPASGRLSCGETGTGRMVEPEQIVAEIIRLTATSNSNSNPTSFPNKLS